MHVTKRDGLQIFECTADDLYDIKISEPYTKRATQEKSHSLFNLTFAYNGKYQSELAGGGIYAIHYDGELLYIGIYTGKKPVPFIGNVANTRLDNHLDVLTMRGRSVGFAAHNYDAACNLPDHELVRAIKQSPGMRKGNSVMSYPCKVKFACENWDAMRSIESDPNGLSRFQLIYARMDPEFYRADINYLQLLHYLENIENHLLKQFEPRCNLSYNAPNSDYLVYGPPMSAWDELKDRIS